MFVSDATEAAQYALLKKQKKTNQADKDHDKVEREQEALAKHHHTVF